MPPAHRSTNPSPARAAGPTTGWTVPRRGRVAGSCWGTPRGGRASATARPRSPRRRSRPGRRRCSRACPTRPSSQGRAPVHQRKPTPWTSPDEYRQPADDVRGPALVHPSILVTPPSPARLAMPSSPPPRCLTSASRRRTSRHGVRPWCEGRALPADVRYQQTPAQGPEADTPTVGHAGAGARVAGPRLAAGAEEGGPVHEGHPLDEGPASGAGSALLAVGVQRPVEVARGAVDVDIQAVEARPPWSSAATMTSRVWSSSREIDAWSAGRRAARRGSRRATGPRRRRCCRSPRRPLVEEHPLDPALWRPWIRRTTAGWSRSGSSRSRRDVGDGERYAVRVEVGEEQPAEGALVDEAELGLAVGEGEPRPQVALRHVHPARSTSSWPLIPRWRTRARWSGRTSQRYLPRRRASSDAAARRAGRLRSRDRADGGG